MVTVPLWVTKCVAFVGSAAKGSDITMAGGKNLRLRGTTFFTSQPISSIPDRHVAIAVTAKHVINGIEAHGQQGYLRRPLLLRGPDGNPFSASVWLEYKYEDWIQHPDPTVDAAIMPMTAVHMFDMSWINPSLGVTPRIIEDEKIGVGAEVFITGLFVNHPGTFTNVPIARVGNIAAMNGPERIATKMGEMEAYLIEARSIGGLSGSPVFVHLGIARIKEAGKAPVYAHDPGGVFYWLGLVHGHFDGNLTSDDITTEDASSTQREQVNTGIAIVVPATKIMEIFDEPQMKAFQEHLATGTFIPGDSGGSPTHEKER